MEACVQHICVDDVIAIEPSPSCIHDGGITVIELPPILPTFSDPGTSAQAIVDGGSPRMKIALEPSSKRTRTVSPVLTVYVFIVFRSFRTHFPVSVTLTSSRRCRMLVFTSLPFGSQHWAETNQAKDALQVKLYSCSDGQRWWDFLGGSVSRAQGRRKACEETPHKDLVRWTSCIVQLAHWI